MEKRSIKTEDGLW